MSNSSESVFNQAATLNLSEANKSDLIYFAVKYLTTQMASSSFHCRNDNSYGWLITESNIEKLWNDLPEIRINLVRILINCYTRNASSVYGSHLLLSPDFSSQKLKQIESMLLNNEDDDSDQIRRIIVPVLYPNYDYKQEITRLSELGRSQLTINNWIELASNRSKDEELFEFLLSNIKRVEGATELKVNLLNKAFDNEVICEKYIKKIAVSAPISLKRAVVNGLCQVLGSCRSDYRLYNLTEEGKFQLQEKVDKIENLAMMFASLDDSFIIKQLGYNLSVKNLPWVLPAAAKHPWIVQEIQRRIDREGVKHG